MPQGALGLPPNEKGGEGGGYSIHERMHLAQAERQDLDNHIGYKPEPDAVGDGIKSMRMI